MNYNKRRYKIILTPQTPIFIGSGKRLAKKEYAYSQKDKNAYIINPHKMFHFLREQNLLKEYQEFMKDSTISNFSKWLCDYGIELSKNQPWVEYVIDTNRNKPFKANEIHCFVKNAYGKPYIPGSSIKGALRTAILIYLLKNEEFKDLERIKKKYKELEKINFSMCGKKVNEVEGQRDKVEQIIMNCIPLKGKVNYILKDFMRAIRISDSESIENAKFSLCKKVDVFYSNGEKKQKEINMLREAITSTKPIEMEMTIDTQLLRHIDFLKTYSDNYSEFLVKAIQQYSETVTEYFVNHFIEENAPEKDTIYLGGGTGFASKTILSALLGDESARAVSARILHNKFPKSHKHDTLDTEVSPHMMKCTKVASDLQVQFGMCKIKIFDL